jgi:uroporphyrinogen decarboxylase
LNSFSRVINAIRHEPGTPIARGELTLDLKFARAFLNWHADDVDLDSYSETDLFIACGKALKLDLICLKSGETKDKETDLPALLDNIGRFDDEGLFVFWVINGAFQTAMERYGMTILGNIAYSPDKFCKTLRQISDQVINAMAQGVAAGAHGIIIADDIAYQQNTYVSPGFVEQHLLSIWQAQVMFAGDLGVPVFFHSDGNLSAIMPYIVAAGFDGLQCLEPAAGMDIKEIKNRYGQDLCLMGNIDPSLLTGEGSPNNIEKQCERLRLAVTDLFAATEGAGGFIFGTCSGLHEGMVPELVQYMYQLASELDPIVHPIAL